MKTLLDDVFAALDIATPNLIFEINNCDEIENWNVKLPPYKKDLAGMFSITAI